MTAPTRLLFATFSAAIAVMAFQSLRKSVRHDERNTATQRSPASQKIRTETIRTDKTIQSAQGNLARKPQNGFALTLRGEVLTNGSAQLTATVQATKPLRDHKFSWILPPSVSQVSGLQTGAVPSLEIGDSVSFVGVFNGVGPSQPVVVHVYTDVTGETVGQVAQWGSNTVSSTRSNERPVVKPEGMVQ